MQLTDTTFKNMLAYMREIYTDWALTKRQEVAWRIALKSKLSDELLKRIVSEWVSNESKPPKVPADLVNYLDDELKKQYDSAEVSAEILLESARSAYTVSDDFVAFEEMYRDSFAFGISGVPAQEAYIKEHINTTSKNPKVLILVYDEVKGDLKSCFTGDAEHGIDFLRGQIKKKWNTKVDDAVKDFLRTGGSSGYLEA